ncbi:hypothetical protein QR721_12790 [Aciduricibacillus chroicocephali]|uniref:Uncharacterized protein n=1 Tax=Aciduricibacillus chroicocephali TaxID=3054939 RepID=A0ABY9KXT0_9BACI|nr:hypothetical protein QR721_12790 [Bacillaceae bacterium 44XB]
MEQSNEQVELLRRKIAKLEVKLEPFWGVDTEELPIEQRVEQLKLIKQIEALHTKLLQLPEDTSDALAIKNGRIITGADDLHDQLELD